MILPEVGGDKVPFNERFETPAFIIFGSDQDGDWAVTGLQGEDFASDEFTGVRGEGLVEKGAAIREEDGVCEPPSVGAASHSGQREKFVGGDHRSLNFDLDGDLWGKSGEVAARGENFDMGGTTITRPRTKVDSSQNKIWFVVTGLVETPFQIRHGGRLRMEFVPGAQCGDVFFVFFVLVIMSYPRKGWCWITVW